METRRRSSLYESHSAVTTPVLTSDSQQTTPQAIRGEGVSPPFEFPPHGTVPPNPLPVGYPGGEGGSTSYSGGNGGAGFSGGESGSYNNPPPAAGLGGKWNPQPGSRTPNTYQYTPATSAGGNVDHSGSSTMSQTLETGVLGRQERATLDSREGGVKGTHPASSSVLNEYLRRGEGFGEEDSTIFTIKVEEGEIKCKNGAGGALPHPLKGTLM